MREGRLSALFQLLLAALWEAQHTPAPSPDEAFAQEVAENFGFCDEFHLSRALRSRTEPPSRG